MSRRPRICSECGEPYWNVGAHAERCYGPLELREPRRSSQLSELPGKTFEEIFVCQIDESAGLRGEADA